MNLCIECGLKYAQEKSPLCVECHEEQIFAEDCEMDIGKCDYCGQIPGFDEGCPLCNDPDLWRDD